ncbi:membrane protein insertion efficiency factor YidD [Hydrogenimonas sp.]
MIRSVLSGFLKLYQKFFTLLGYGSCRYYPTCSEYAKWQLETNPSLVKALLSSMIRILRCNQLFDGGIDYPKVSMRPSAAFHHRHHRQNVKYWFVPDRRNGRWNVIKNIFSKGHS